MKTGQSKLTSDVVVDLGVGIAYLVTDISAAYVVRKVIDAALPEAPNKAIAIIYKIGSYGVAGAISYGVGGMMSDLGDGIKKGITIFKKFKESKISSGDEDGSGDTETELE